MRKIKRAVKVRSFIFLERERERLGQQSEGGEEEEHKRKERWEVGGSSNSLLKIIINSFSIIIFWSILLVL